MSNITLPPALAAFLRNQGSCCLPHRLQRGGSCLLVRVDEPDIGHLSGVVSVDLKFAVFQCPTAPVIRSLLVIKDKPTQPLYLEFFTNVEEGDQVLDFIGLVYDETVPVYYFDKDVEHRYTKVIAVPDAWRVGLPRILARAQSIRAAIPNDNYDFDLAKELVIDQTDLVSAPF